LDAILVARDQGLYTAITDCGAGGLSSAVSEMGRELGARVALDRVPLKYLGLQPWEIWLSEAQERMVLAVPPENEGHLHEICDRYSVEMTVIGRFADDGRLRLTYEGATVADLPMDFLHGGLPRRHLKAKWREPSNGPLLPSIPSNTTWRDILVEMLAHPNVRSKEDVVRRYDHEVQGATLIKPFVGVRAHGPSDGVVLRPIEVADAWRGIALGCGFNPSYGLRDPYAMAISAIDEAVRNVVCMGANPERIAILDNFCWGNPQLPDRLGALVRALKGCYDGALHYGTPFISGKDSLNNEYIDRGTGQSVAIPPSLLISAIGIVDDVRHSCSSDLKQAGNLLYLVGETLCELGQSLYAQLLGFEGGALPTIAEHGPKAARAVHQAIEKGLVYACHDCSEGGLAVAIAEMCLAGALGAEIRLDCVPTSGTSPRRDDWLLFSESNGRYLVEVPRERANEFEALMSGVPHSRIGQVTDKAELIVMGIKGQVLFSIPINELEQAWRGHLETGKGESLR